tara:strand:- start:1384 stop:1629 length:246 start_codon:yes stop_codon:yes gene_type:complete
MTKFEEDLGKAVEQWCSNIGREQHIENRIRQLMAEIKWIKSKQKSLIPKIKKGGSVKEYETLENQKKEKIENLKWHQLKEM